MVQLKNCAINILKEHEKVLHEVAGTLQDKEVINNEEIQAIVDKEKEENKSLTPNS